MPSHVVKRAPDVDEYLIFSTVVDHPTSYICTREEILEFDEVDEERVARADQHGTSALWPSPGKPAYGWGKETFLMRNCDNLPDTDDGWAELTREQVFEHMKADLARESTKNPGDADG